MEAIHKERLEKLADYLSNGIPEDRFTMARYRKSDDMQHICGTAGCALGWSPAIMDKETFSSFLNGKAEIHFAKISEDYFGVEDGSEVWHYLFGIGWQYIDNTPQGAAARIRYFLENGVPDDFKGYYDDTYEKEHYQKYLTTGA